MSVIEEVRVQSRTETITAWYVQVFPLVAAYVQRKGGDMEDAREVFQEAVVLYYEKLVHSGFRPEENDEAYLLGIAKKRWLKHCSKRQHHESLKHVEMPEERDPKPIVQRLLNQLRQTGEKCLNVLQAFYYEKQTMKQIAHRFSYTSERSATVQKYKCLEKIRNQVKRKSLSYEDFID